MQELVRYNRSAVQSKMKATAHKPRLAVVSPFLDKRHGTERITIEWLSNLPSSLFDIHVYSQRVEDLSPGKFTWHRIPKLVGPHLFNFLWWLAANHLWRAWDRHIRGLRYDLVFSPGINCFDADVISVQIVFAELVRQARHDLWFRSNPVSFWPRLLHRRIYYSLAIQLEKMVYPKPKTQLVLYAQKTAGDLKRFYGCNGRLPVLYLGIDHDIFNVARIGSLRRTARKELDLSELEFTALLIGNDLIKKGLPVLVNALIKLPELPITLIVVSREPRGLYRSVLADLGNRVRFLPIRRDVELYYAAADVYIGPSLEDTFSMPPAEAMACGLPVIVSATAGVSEIITDGTDGFVLKDPRDATGLATMVRRLYEDKGLRGRLGEWAAATARKYTWESNGRDLAAIFKGVLERKLAVSGQSMIAERPDR